MKKFIAISFVMIFSIIIFAGCSMDPTDADALVGTKWEAAVAGTGVRLVFDSETEVIESVIALGAVVDSTTYTYTYDPVMQTGVIDDYWDFEINEDGTELEYIDVVFEYKPF